MTIKDDLHALIDELDETDAREALEFIKARLELDPNVSQAYIAECEAAHDEAHAPEAVLLPHEAVRTWVQAWVVQTKQLPIATLKRSNTSSRTRHGPAPLGEDPLVTARS